MIDRDNVYNRMNIFANSNHCYHMNPFRSVQLCIELCGFSYCIYLPNAINFIAKFIFLSPQIPIESARYVFAKICPNTIKRTTTNLIRIVCLPYIVCFLDWDILHFCLFCHSKTMYCHIDTSLCCCPFCCCFFSFFSLSYFRFLRDVINKRGNFCVVRWFLIHHFVCHCFFFLKQFCCSTRADAS